jgi:hypothetical protein
MGIFHFFDVLALKTWLHGRASSLNYTLLDRNEAPCGGCLPMWVGELMCVCSNQPAPLFANILEYFMEHGIQPNYGWSAAGQIK